MSSAYAVYIQMRLQTHPAKIYIVGTQMNDIVETVHLITQNISFGLTKRKLSTFMLKFWFNWNSKFWFNWNYDKKKAVPLSL